MQHVPEPSSKLCYVTDQGTYEHMKVQIIKPHTPIHTLYAYTTTPVFYLSLPKHPSAMF